MKKKFFSIVGIVAGAFSIIMSFVVNGASTGYYSSSHSYGGDAYTGIQNAAADTANNITYVGDMIQLGLFAVLFAFGLACIAFFGKQLLDELNEEKKEKSEKDAELVFETPEVEIVEVSSETDCE